MHRPLVTLARAKARAHLPPPATASTTAISSAAAGSSNEDRDVARPVLPVGSIEHGPSRGAHRFGRRAVPQDRTGLCHRLAHPAKPGTGRKHGAPMTMAARRDRCSRLRRSAASVTRGPPHRSRSARPRPGTKGPSMDRSARRLARVKVPQASDPMDSAPTNQVHHARQADCAAASISSGTLPDAKNVPPLRIPGLEQRIDAALFLEL